MTLQDYYLYAKAENPLETKFLVVTESLYHSGPEVIKLFHAQLSWEWNLFRSEKIKYHQSKLFSCKAELSMKFFLLINIEMPTELSMKKVL